jgi:peptidyl-prolyl cis-trans isomerase A (cyclophilin A)/peptidyl-prolyl cis-trans isomerase-like 1
MRVARVVAPITVACILVGWFAAPRAAVETAPTGVKAILELGQQFFYAGDPLFMRVSIGNEGDTQVANPVKTPLFRAFEIRPTGGDSIEQKGRPGVEEPSRPDKLSPKGFYGAVVDLSLLYPELKKPGQYEIRWSADGVSSETIVVRIIPKYDPAKEYLANVDTDEGTFVVDFFRATAPVAVKAFVDMANSGIYDGLVFHEIRRDWLVASGDPAGDGSGAAPFMYPAELSQVPVVTGTVVVRPVGASPPANGSQFMIVLRPEPSWKGQLTVLGQVVQGLEVVQKISKLPSSEQASRPFYRPLKDVHIRKITIVEKTVP